MAETNPNGGVPETSASTAPSASVSEASQATETTEATDPMSTAPAEPTEAQQEQAGLSSDKPSEEAVNLYRQDAEWRAEHPSEARVREANPKVGGEDNSYLDTLSA